MFRIHIGDMRQYLSPKRWLLLWYRQYKKLIFLGFVVVLGFGGYFWYSNVYQYRWTAEQKNQFVEANFKATVFQEAKFERLVTALKERAKRHLEPVVLSRDIFSGKPISREPID